MRNIGLVSAAVIAMAAMAGAVAASAPPVIQSRPLSDIESALLGSRPTDDATARVQGMGEVILATVDRAERNGLSGEPAQESIKSELRSYLSGNLDQFGRPNGFFSPGQLSLTLSLGRRSLIDSNRLRRGSDGDLAISALLAERAAESRAERTSRSGAGFNPLGGPLRGGRGAGPLGPPQAPVAVQGSPTAGDAGRNVPGNAAAGQPATDAATTEVQQSQTTDDPDLDDEAGEPD
jgi:hypothetical protein